MEKPTGTEIFKILGQQLFSLGFQERTEPVNAHGSILYNELTFLCSSIYAACLENGESSQITALQLITTLNFLTTLTEKGWFKGVYHIEKDSPKD